MDKIATGLSISPVQVKMARVALGIGVRDLAKKVGLSTNTIARMERGEELKVATVAAIRTALEAGGVVFIAENGDGPGVRLRKDAHDADIAKP